MDEVNEKGLSGRSSRLRISGTGYLWSQMITMLKKYNQEKMVFTRSMGNRGLSLVAHPANRKRGRGGDNSIGKKQST